MRAAIITAAGWKGTCTNYDDTVVPQGCPESLLPVGSNGDTLLSRQVRQFRELGYSPIFVGVGRPGCMYPNSATVALDAGYIPETWQGMRVSPWTWERVEYANSLAIPILIRNPDDGSPADTACRIMRATGTDFDEILINAGDTYFKTVSMQKILEVVPVPAFTTHGGHHIYRLNRETAPVYIERAERPFDVPTKDWTYSDLPPEIPYVKLEFKKYLIALGYHDVDHWKRYEKARGLIEEWEADGL